MVYFFYLIVTFLATIGVVTLVAVFDQIRIESLKAEAEETAKKEQDRAAKLEEMFGEDLPPGMALDRSTKLN